MYNKLQNVILGSRIWDGARAQSHAFRLSPSVYEITNSQRHELEKLGHAIFDCMRGLSQIAVVTASPNLGYQNSWNIFRSVFSTGVPKMYTELQGMHASRIPQLLKLDLMLDINGNFKIAEIDGHNKHGLGYSTLGKMFREQILPGSNALPGVVKTLSKEIARQGHPSIKFFYADQERFYIPEFEIAKEEFYKNGIECQLFSEYEASEEMLQSGLFLDLPFLYREPKLYDTIIRSYKSGCVSFIIPPKPFLGSKGVLAILRNDNKDEHMEAILNAFISRESLQLLRQYIPETLLVGKKGLTKDEISDLIELKDYVLKESISSGMKGTLFSGTSDFNETLDEACSSRMNWVLQEEVQNQKQSFCWYDGGNMNQSSDWHMRITAHYVQRSLADIIVTARRDKAVHGAKDCIQIGTAIV